VALTDMKPSLAGGELSPALHGRVDLEKYQSGLKTCSNFIVMPEGGVTLRAGTSYVGAAGDESAAVRVIPFRFNTAQAYCLEFGDKYMRVEANGGQIVETELLITGATNASPGVFEVENHGYSDGDEVYVGGVLGMVEINGRSYRVDAIDTDHFSLVYIDGTPVDTTDFGVFTGCDGGVTIPDPGDVPGSGEGGSGGEPDPTPPGYYPPDPPPVIPRCVWVEALLPGLGRAGDARAGDPLLKMAADGSGAAWGVIEAISFGEEPCFRLVTMAGALTVSHTAPIPVFDRDARAVAYRTPGQLHRGDLLAVGEMDNLLAWSPLVAVETAGVLPIAQISCGDGVYAAGDEPGRWIFTHNRKADDVGEF